MGGDPLKWHTIIKNRHLVGFIVGLFWLGRAKYYQQALIRECYALLTARLSFPTFKLLVSDPRSEKYMQRTCRDCTGTKMIVISLVTTKQALTECQAF